MGSGKKKTIQQKMQSFRAESKSAEENIAYTMPTTHGDKHEPNRPSIG
jgi:hypothetical protein